MTQTILQQALQAKNNHYYVSLSGCTKIDNLNWQYEYTGYITDVQENSVHLCCLNPDSRIYKIDFKDIELLKLVFE